jgi:hypothetical protein
MNEGRDGSGDAGSWGATRRVGVPTRLRAIFQRSCREAVSGRASDQCGTGQVRRGAKTLPGGGGRRAPSLHIGRGFNSDTVLVRNTGSVQRPEALGRTTERRVAGLPDRRLPAAHHMATRDLQPPIIARPMRFAAQAEAWAHHRGGTPASASDSRPPHSLYPSRFLPPPLPSRFHLSWKGHPTM